MTGEDLERRARPDGAAAAAAGDVARAAPPDVVGPRLAEVLDDPSFERCAVDLISGGKSNLTFVVTADDGAGREVVLRRPPLSSVLPTAHDMVREHTVMTALAGTDVPVPRTFHLEDADGVLGAPFYVMERVRGHVARERLPEGYATTPAERRAVADGLVDVLVALHAVRPDDVGLGEFGRPDGYLGRQVRRWGRQWEATRQFAADAPTLDPLLAELGEHLPTTRRTGVVHGDYRLDNTLLHPDTPGRVAAVLDWEMSTLGDPLADVGLLLVYWAQPGDDPQRFAGAPVDAVTTLEGFPSRREVAERYGDATGTDVDDLSWYVAFGYLKLAVVCAGIAARHAAGAMLGEGFEGMGDKVEPLARLGRQAWEGDPTA